MLQAVSNVMLYGMRSVVLLHAGLLVPMVNFFFFFFYVGRPCHGVHASVLKILSFMI